jgi:DNA-binding NarL/FixJ family response regulator
VADQLGDVVLVDDDAAFRVFLKDALEWAGYKTREFATAEEALPEVEHRRPALVLADVHLPGISGYELCHQIRGAYGDDLRVILVSGERTEPFDRAAGISLGADDYMTKPVDPGELVARVTRLLGRPHSGGAVRPNQGARASLGTLTSREREVLDHLAAGMTQEEIAETLFISPKTVATHIQRILGKLGVHSRAQAVAFAFRDEHDVAAHALGLDRAGQLVAEAADRERQRDAYDAAMSPKLPMPSA